MSRQGACLVTSLVLSTALLWTSAQATDADTSRTQHEDTEISRTETTFTDPRQTRQQTLKQWHIDAKEYDRYQTLMNGPRGALSVANISPLEVLGIHARSPEERRAYADRLVRLMYEDTERVLAFEYEVQAAWKRLGQPMFDPAKLPAAKGVNLATDTKNRRLALFVSTDAVCLDCLNRTRALARRTDIAGLDIYVTNTNDADAIRAFARKAGIAPKDVKAKRITLNQGATLFALYGGNTDTLPQTFVRDGKQLVPVSITASASTEPRP